MLQKTEKEDALNRILARIFDLEVGLRHEKQELETKLQEVNDKLQGIKKERELLRLVGEDRDLDFVHLFEEEETEEEQKPDGSRVTRTRKKRYTKKEKIDVENLVEQLGEEYGRPMKMREIIANLERHGYEWSRYTGAYQFISKLNNLEKVGHGYYQLKR